MTAARLPGAETPLPDFDRLWDYQNPAATEEKFAAIVPQAKAAGNQDYLAQLLTQLARAQGLQKKTDAAHRTLDEARALIKPEMKRAHVRYLLERGRAFNGLPSAYDPADEPKYQKARVCFLEAWEIGQAAGEDVYAVDAAHMMAIVTPPNESLEWNARAIAFVEQSKNPRVKGWLGPLYNNTGWSYHDLGKYDEALQLFEKDASHRTSLNRPDEARIARWAAAVMLRKLNRVDEALSRQLALAREWEAVGRSAGFVFEEIGENLLAAGRPSEAKQYFALAYAELSKDRHFMDAQPKRLERIKTLGGN